MPRRLKSRGAREPSAETKTAGKVANTSTAASEATILELGPSSFRSQRQRCAPFPTAFSDGPTRPTFRHGPPRKNRPLPSYLAHPVPWPTLSEREGLIAFLARPWFDDGGNYRVVFSRRLCDFIFFFLVSPFQWENKVICRHLPIRARVDVFISNVSLNI